MTLASLVQSCSPHVAPRTSLAIISVESGGNPWAIDDDTGRRSYFPKTKDAAVTLAQSLLAQGHNIDMGLMQVNSVHLGSFGGLEVTQVFDPCINVFVGGSILTSAYHQASRAYGPGMTALYHAFEIYNSGNPWAAPSYAKQVWSAGLSL